MSSTYCVLLLRVLKYYKTIRAVSHGGERTMSRVMIYPATYEGCPQADMGTCIACFCCQEICPEKAITLM